jgi:DNA-nicking Smr family endonuclease
MNSPKISKTDREHFLAAMSDVTPMKAPDTLEPERGTTPAIPRQRKLDEAAVLEELKQTRGHADGLETGEELLFLRTGYRRTVMRRLRRGHYSTADTIDLHHMDEQTARQVLQDFLEVSLSRGFSCVRVIHGKGLRSRNVPVLKLLTNKILRQHPAVAAFASCRPVDGGTGAVDVLLSARRARP